MFLIVGIVFAITSDVVYIGKLKRFRFCYTQHFISFFLIQEFSMLIQQLQSVPLSGIVAGSQNNATARSFHGYSQFCSRCRCQSDIHHIKPHSH